MDGRKHYDARYDAQKQWIPSLKTGIEPVRGEPRKEAVKFVGYKPQPRKGEPERTHLRDKFDSLVGPTFDKTGQSLKPFAHANQVTEKEYNQESVMT